VYDTDGIPSESGTLLPVMVACNETGGSFGSLSGNTTSYDIDSWTFEAILRFEKEVDVTDFLLSFNLTFTYNNDYAVIIGLDSSFIAEHPVTQGSHGGTKYMITFTAIART